MTYLVRHLLRGHFLKPPNFYLVQRNPPHGIILEIVIQDKIVPVLNNLKIFWGRARLLCNIVKNRLVVAEVQLRLRGISRRCDGRNSGG